MPINLNRATLKSFSEIEALLLVAVYAPIREELAFRLALKFSKRNLIIGAFGFSLILCRVLATLKYEYAIALSIGITVLVYIILKGKTLSKLSGFWNKHQIQIFYTSLVIFSFLHLKNYELTMEVLIFSPIIILLRILGGIIYSYLRFSAGIIMAIIFHSFNNSLLILISAFSS